MPGQDEEIVEGAVEPEPVSETLYHYTDGGGFLGIVSSRSIFATKVQYFNDSSEFHLGLDLVLESISELELDTDEMEARIRSLRNVHVFLVSLTEEGDLLSQWRAYGSARSGFSLGFDGDALKESAEDQGWALIKCLYDPLEQHEAVKGFVDYCMEHEEGRIARLLRLAASIKHPSFEEEQEWRLVSPILSEDHVTFDYRVGTFALIPYVQYPLIGLDGSFLLSDVVVGPTAHPSLSIQSAAGLLRAKGVSAAVSKSEASLREW